MRTTSKRLPSVTVTLLFCSVFFLGSSAPASAQGQTSQVIVFGDSISDPGNGFSGLKTSSTPPDYDLSPLLVPNSPYAKGGHHLTNGPTWIEQLAGSLGAERSVLPAFVGSNPYAMNFAVATGRARTLANNPGLAFQIAAFLQKTGGQIPSDALYVIEIGSNDIRDALATGDPVQALAIIQAAVAAIGDAVDLLHALGAEHILVWNVPDAGLTPAAAIAGISAEATLASQTFNALLLAELTPEILSGVVIPFDAFGFVTSIVENPAAFGLTNVEDPCVTPNDAPFVCKTPDTYLFWDGVHVTTAAHALVAQAVAAILGV